MNTRYFASATLALGLFASTSQAAFHVMQIEEIIGGVNGNTSAQAIQLRMRTGGQTVLSNSRLLARDATGANPILLLDITSNLLSPNGATGDNFLIASSAFNTIMTSVYGASYASDYVLTNLIPPAYLSAGRLTFEDDGGTIYWSTSFGSYSGSNLGSTQNDVDGNFGPSTLSVPTNSRTGLRFTGTAGAPSTNNLADYALTSNPASVRNNARNSFVVAPEPGSAALLAAMVLGGLAIARRRS